MLHAWLPWLGQLFVMGVVVRLGWGVGRIVENKLIIAYNTLVFKLGLDRFSI
jgi:hypothetical protein